LSSTRIAVGVSSGGPTEARCSSSDSARPGGGKGDRQGRNRGGGGGGAPGPHVGRPEGVGAPPGPSCPQGRAGQRHCGEVVVFVGNPRREQHHPAPGRQTASAAGRVHGPGGPEPPMIDPCPGRPGWTVCRGPAADQPGNGRGAPPTQASWGHPRDVCFLSIRGPAATRQLGTLGRGTPQFVSNPATTRWVGGSRQTHRGTSYQILGKHTGGQTDLTGRI